MGFPRWAKSNNKLRAGKLKGICNKVTTMMDYEVQTKKRGKEDMNALKCMPYIPK